MGKDEDDEKLLAELKKARQEDEDSAPVKKAGKEGIAKQAFEAKHGRGKKNGQR